MTATIIPMVPRTAHLSVRRVKQGWWIGKSPGAVFFGPTLGEVLFKFMRHRREQYLASIRPNRVADKIITRIHDEQTRQIH